MKKDHPFILRHELKRHLKDRGITASELGRETGVSKQVISDWLAGVMPRNLKQLKAVSSFLGLAVDTLCFGDQPPMLDPATNKMWITGRFEGKIRIIPEE